MAIDINEEIKVWGGFNPQDFWLGVGVLLLLACVALLIGSRATPLVGALFFGLVGGGFCGFMVYRQCLPKGLLERRFRQEGRFLFIRVPGIRGVDLYYSPADERSLCFEEAFEETYDRP